MLNMHDVMTSLKNYGTSILNRIKAEVHRSVACVPESFSQMKRNVYRSNPPD